MADSNSALALSIFDKFLTASTQESILLYFRKILDLLDLQPTYFPEFISKLKVT